MLILGGLLALAVGWYAGGRLSRFEGAGLRLLLLPVLALALQRAAALFSPEPYSIWGWTLLPASYLLLFAFLWFNRHLRKTALLMGLGSLCNLAVIAVNGWRMPVAPSALALLSPEGAASLLAGRVPMYCAAGGSTRLLFLGDIFYCPIPFFQGFASVGDILLALGLFFCLMAVMNPERLPRWLKAG